MNMDDDPEPIASSFQPVERPLEDLILASVTGTGNPGESEWWYDPADHTQFLGPGWFLWRHLLLLAPLESLNTNFASAPYGPALVTVKWELLDAAGVPLSTFTRRVTLENQLSPPRVLMSNPLIVLEGPSVSEFNGTRLTVSDDIGTVILNPPGTLLIVGNPRLHGLDGGVRT